MASDLTFVEFVTDQIDGSREMSYRKMFGEYALYSKGKVLALVCDDQLFVKPTDAGRSFIGEVLKRLPSLALSSLFSFRTRLKTENG